MNMRTVSIQQVRQTVIRYVRDENQASGRAPASAGTTAAHVSADAQPDVAQSSARVARLKASLRRIPIVAPILVTLYRLLKLPGRIALIVRQLETLQGQVQDLTRVHERIDALSWHMSALEQRSAAGAERLEELLKLIEERLEERFRLIEGRLVGEAERSSRALHRAVSDTAQTLIALHEKTDRYQIELNQHFRAIKPVIHAGDNLIVSRVDDLIMAFPSEEWRLPVYQILVGPLEPGLVAAMKAVIREGHVVIDIGANVGTYTLLALRATGSRGLVVGYEPTPRVFDVLKNNVRINGFLETGRVDLRQKAVSDGRTAIATFYVSHNSLMNSLYGEDTSSPTGSTTIDVVSVSLDSDLAHLDRIDVVKIDAEGAEPVILRGMQQIIRRSPGITIFIEFAPVHLVRANEDPQAFLAELRAQGFAIEEVCEPSGALRTPTDEELCNCFSVNLMLRQPVR
jgi:FkbM family methyltransferase